MGLGLAVICGMAAAIAVPVMVAKAGGPDDAWLVGRLVHLPVGGGMALRWSWPIFCIATLAIWGLLAATRER